MLSKVTQFARIDVWRIRSSDLPRSKSFLVRLLRILILSVRGLVEDKCQLKASALTFYTSLSIVPIFAMVFGVAKGFGFEKVLEKQVLEKLEGQGEVVTRVIDYANALLVNTKGGMMAGIGVVVLFWAIIKVLGNIEKSFNDIWGVKKGRPFRRKITDYLSIMLIGPVLFIVSSGITVLMASQAKIFVEKITLLGPISPIIFFVLKLLPYGTIWVLFIFIYIFMPTTKVHFRSGALAGIIAGSMYQIFHW
ncbi:MAG: YihY/virulence factor BrkB family protein, partial [Desulfobacterales bacterium]